MPAQLQVEKGHSDGLGLQFGDPARQRDKYRHCPRQQGRQRINEDNRFAHNALPACERSI